MELVGEILVAIGVKVEGGVLVDLGEAGSGTTYNRKSYSHRVQAG